MPPEAHIDLASIDQTKVIADRDAIRRVNPQRYEMEQLTAIVFVDAEQQLIAGYKDVGKEEFWVRGHMPDYPLMPGVVMCEAAAQLCSYYIATQGLMQGDYIGFGGFPHRVGGEDGWHARDLADAIKGYALDWGRPLPVSIGVDLGDVFELHQHGAFSS